MLTAASKGYVQQKIRSDAAKSTKVNFRSLKVGPKNTLTFLVVLLHYAVALCIWFSLNKCRIDLLQNESLSLK